MLRVEVGESTLRRRLKDLQVNNNDLRAELDTVEEIREIVVVWAEAQKRLVTTTRR